MKKGARGRAKKKGQMFWLHSDLYHSGILVAAGRKFEEVEREFRKKTLPFEERIEEVRPTWRAFTAEHPVDKCQIIWFRDVRPKGHIVAHEALHAASFILRRSGIDWSNSSAEEAYAYLLEWIVREIGRRVW